MDTGQEPIDTNRSGTVENTKVSESFDVNVNINFGGESNVALQDNKDSDAVQVSDPSLETQTLDRDTNNSIQKDMNQDSNCEKEDSNKLNESILSETQTNKSKKKVTFQK